MMMTTRCSSSERRLVGGGRQRVQQFYGCLGCADFGRVDARADRDDGLVRRRQAPRVVLRERAWIGELLVGGADLIEIADVRRRRDDGRRGAMAFGRRAEIDERDAIRRRRECLEVLVDVVSGRDLAVAARAETELSLGTGETGLRLSGDDARQQREREQNGACAHAPS